MRMVSGACAVALACCTMTSAAQASTTHGGSRASMNTPVATKDSGTSGMSYSAWSFQTLPGKGSVAHRRAVVALLSAINADRARRGEVALTLSQQQSSCSLVHTRHMAHKDALSHDQFPEDVCAAHTLAGENAGDWQGGPLSAIGPIHATMMAEGPCTKPCSPAQFRLHGHYMNITNAAFRHVGIGIVVYRGVTWLTEDFTN